MCARQWRSGNGRRQIGTPFRSSNPPPPKGTGRAAYPNYTGTKLPAAIRTGTCDRYLKGSIALAYRNDKEQALLISGTLVLKMCMETSCRIAKQLKSHETSLSCRFLREEFGLRFACINLA